MPPTRSKTGEEQEADAQLAGLPPSWLPTNECALDAWVFWAEAVEHRDAAKWIRGINSATVGLNRVANGGFRRLDMEAWLQENLTGEGWDLFRDRARNSRRAATDPAHDPPAPAQPRRPARKRRQQAGGLPSGTVRRRDL
jgi:hypothetical protein